MVVDETVEGGGCCGMGEWCGQFFGPARRRRKNGRQSKLQLIYARFQHEDAVRQEAAAGDRKGEAEGERRLGHRRRQPAALVASGAVGVRRGAGHSRKMRERAFGQRVYIYLPIFTYTRA